jgi:CTP synthase
VDTIYSVPISYHEQGFGKAVLKHFGLPEGKQPDLSRWKNIVTRVRNPESDVKIGIVGKYTTMLDSYKSLSEALVHGGIANNVRVKLVWLDSEIFEDEHAVHHLEGVTGILVPGGFGERGSMGKIRAAQFAREHKVPYFGICFGMQMAVIEFARNVIGLTDAHSTEMDSDTTHPVIALMEEQKTVTSKGGTMRLGAYQCELAPDSLAHKIYETNEISERHRHRWEFNNLYLNEYIKNGMVPSGKNIKEDLVEIIEIKDHPFFIGVQYHPELKSTVENPHPIFVHFVKAAIDHAEKNA